MLPLSQVESHLIDGKMEAIQSFPAPCVLTHRTDDSSKAAFVGHSQGLPYQEAQSSQAATGMHSRDLELQISRRDEFIKSGGYLHRCLKLEGV